MMIAAWVVIGVYAVAVISMSAGMALGEFNLGVFLRVVLFGSLALIWAIKTIKRERQKNKEGSSNG